MAGAVSFRLAGSGLTTPQRKQVEELIAEAGGCPAAARTFYVDRTAAAGGDGSVCKPFQTVQQAMNAIGPAATSASFQDQNLRGWMVFVAPGVYTENVAVPLRPEITVVLNNAVIVGDVSMTFDWAPFSLQGPLQQIKLKIVGNDLRSAFQTNLNTQMPIDGIDGNIVFAPSNGGSSLFIQLHLINTGVTGVPGTFADPPTGTGHIKTSATAHSCQVFCENAIVKGDFYVPAGAAGTLYIANSDSSSSASFGGVIGAVVLNVLRNVRFLRPVDTSSGAGGRWFNVEFRSGQAHDFTGTAGTISADYNSFVSYFNNVPTKGGETFTILDVLAGSTANRPTTRVQRGAMYYDTTLSRPIWREPASGTGWIFADGTAA